MMENQPMLDPALAGRFRWKLPRSQTPLRASAIFLTQTPSTMSYAVGRRPVVVVEK